MPFCVSCGVRIAEGEQYCAGCEAKFNPKPACLRCGTPYSSPEAKFCMVCGTNRTVPRQPSPPQTQSVAPPVSAPRPAPPPQATRRAPPAAVPSPGAPAQPQAPGAAGSVCPQCGKAIKVSKAKFCIYCAAPLPAGMIQSEPAAEPKTTPTAAPEPVAAGAPQSPSPTTASLTSEQRNEIESVAENRLGIYQRIGRQFLSVCRQGGIPKDRLPADLAQEIDRAVSALQNGHTRLMRAGVCPRCQDTALAAETGRCPKCGLTVTT